MVSAVDGPVSQYLETLVEMSIKMIIKISAVVVVTPAFVGPGLLVFLLGAWVGQIYMKAQLPVKREMSNAKSPVLGQWVMFGLTSCKI